MRIPNKFSGYRFDGTRNLHDPVTLAAVASQAGGIGAAGAALGTTSAALLPAAAAAAAPVATSAALGILPEATGILPEALGGAQGIMQTAAPVADASAKALATEQGLAQGVGDTTAQLTNQINTAAAPGTPSPTATPTPGTSLPAPGTPSIPNVTTTPTGAEQAASSNYYREALQNAPQTVGSPQSGGIMDQLKNFTDPLTSGFQKAMDYAKENPKTTAAGLYGLSKIIETKPSGGKDKYKGSSFDYNAFNTPSMNPLLYGANGGLMQSYADGGVTANGPVENMSQQNAIGANTGYPMANQQTFGYSNIAAAPQNPVSQNMLAPEGDMAVDPYTGEPKFAKGGTTTDDDNGMTRFRKQLAKQEAEQEAAGEALYQHGRGKVENRGVVSYPLSESSTDLYTASVNRMKKANQVAGIKMHPMPKINMPESFSVTEAAGGGIMHGDLGGYSDGGRLLKGPGDGVSDSIPAVIGNKQPARLADGEFVVPARIVSELGNGSTEAGARKLYAMMERIQKNRSKSVGKNKVAVNSKSDKHLPA